MSRKRKPSFGSDLGRQRSAYGKPRRQPSALTLSRTRFLTWWRVLVLAAVVVMMGVTLLYLHGPAQIRRLFYPIDYEAQIAQAAEDNQVSPYLIAAIILSESGWDKDAISTAGAVGLMQMLPETAEEVASAGLVDTEAFPVDRLADPEVNIQYGSAYLRYLVEHYGELEHAIAAYNAGMGNVDAWAEAGEDIRNEVEFPETSHYLLRVVRSKEAYEELYPDLFPGWGD